METIWVDKALRTSIKVGGVLTVNTNAIGRIRSLARELIVSSADSVHESLIPLTAD